MKEETQFAKNLKAIRGSITQEKFCSKIHPRFFSVRTLQDWEQSRWEPSELLQHLLIKRAKEVLNK